MPNHESNYVAVVGDPEKIRRFLDEAFSPGEEGQPALVLDFNLIVPEPANIEVGGCNGQHDEGVVCWYEWHLANWGTKWGAYEHHERVLTGNEGTACVQLQFETAWNQPAPIFKAIEARWDVKVYAVTIDEGGFPPVRYGGDEGYDYLSIRTVVDFEDWS